jgi:hypothetical protein
MKLPIQDYAGVIHVHTRHSDGSGTIPEVISYAQQAELDILIITDHNHMKARKFGAEGWHGEGTKKGTGISDNSQVKKGRPLLVLVGEEITRREGDCLALHVEPDGFARKKAHEYIPMISQKGGLTFLCHPHFGAKPQFKISDSSWKRWDIFNDENETGKSYWPTGLELWSHLGDWAEDLTWQNFLAHIKSPDKYIEGPNPKTLQAWDKFTQIQPLVAFGGADAHAKAVLPFRMGITVTYLESFKGVRTHIFCEKFSGNWNEDSLKVYSALGKGNCYVSYDALANPKGFVFEALDDNKNILAIMGDTLKNHQQVHLRTHSPHTYSQIRLVHNGNLIQESHKTSLEYPVLKPGVYRVEIHLKNRPWLYSNPIYIR